MPTEKTQKSSFSFIDDSAVMHKPSAVMHKPSLFSD
jgi:hypothetical protein